MSVEEFHKTYPGFNYRLVVKKFPVTGGHVREWLTNNFGQSGLRWRYQPMAHPLYLVYWFKEESDLSWAQLRWQ